MVETQVVFWVGHRVGGVLVIRVDGTLGGLMMGGVLIVRVGGTQGGWSTHSQGGWHTGWVEYRSTQGSGTFWLPRCMHMYVCLHTHTHHMHTTHTPPDSFHHCGLCSWGRVTWLQCRLQASLS